MDASLERIARWLAERPWNRTGADKSWVLDAMWGALRFDAERSRAERVRGREASGREKDREFLRLFAARLRDEADGDR